MAGHSSSKQGYSALAELFACFPSLAFFHLFKDLNAANLLDLQAELLLLRRNLEVFTHDEEMSLACTERNPLTASVHHLKQSDWQSCRYHERLWRTKLEIRQKLKEYNEALVHFEHLMSHTKPDRRQLQALRTWLKSKSHGHAFPPGVEHNTWSQEAEDDLACLGWYGKDTDLFTRLLEGPLLDWWHDAFGKATPDSLITREDPPSKKIHEPLIYYSETYASHIVSTVNIIFASLLPSFLNYVLCYIESQVTRTWALSIISVLFSTLIMILTNAKRSEIFVAVPAFMAVQVLFLSNQNNVN